ncbi:hypothetical protein [[Clostridium] fimetarium]|uniref:Uncharacterized protein n=1 Tax=[Clostridium] fimetarium TaxID=99656 RepID=A0A1I0N7J1_9FIRM|nr:hypothetical protein [[Clostridium] fimetarium]SEV96388.1 hypothetical protein SAMN05421659_102393 [[Clostridium] fimetarium]
MNDDLVQQVEDKVKELGYAIEIIESSADTTYFAVKENRRICLRRLYRKKNIFASLFAKKDMFVSLDDILIDHNVYEIIASKNDEDVELVNRVKNMTLDDKKTRLEAEILFQLVQLTIDSKKDEDIKLVDRIKNMKLEDLKTQFEVEISLQFI